MSGSTLFSIGEAYIEMIPSPADGSTADAPAYRPRIGGGPAGVCTAFARLGGKSALLGQLGDDPFGRQIARELAAAGVDTSHLAFTGSASTALYFAEPQPDGSRSFSVYGKPAAGLLYAPEQLDPRWLNDAFALHVCSASLVDSPLRYAHLSAAIAAREAGTIVSFAPQPGPARWADPETLRQTVRQFLPFAHILTLTGTEPQFLTRTPDPEAALPQLFAGDVQLILYAGSGRVHALTRTASISVPGQVPDADAFAAAFLWQLAHDGIPAWKLPGLSRRRLEQDLTAALVLCREL